MLRSLALLTVLACGAAGDPAPADLRDIAGVWTHGAALRTILAQRSPHAAVAENVAIAASSASEGRLDWSNGHEASWRRIVRIESLDNETVLVVAAWEEPSSQPKDLVRVPVRLERDESGRLQSLTFVDGVLVTAHGQPWTRIEEPVAVHLNKKILVGTYRDGQGRTWTFTPEGKAVWPDRTFNYEVSIDASEADCDYIFHPQKGEVGETKRYGFRWQDGRLRIYAIAYPQDGAAPIHCEALMAELTRR
jgi:hypothetical protein